MARYDNISRDLLKRMLDQAAASGHTLSIEHREPPPNVDGLIKYWAVCTCGYRSTARRSASSVLSTLAWHAGTMAGEASRNGSPATSSSATRPPETAPARPLAL